MQSDVKPPLLFYVTYVVMSDSSFQSALRLGLSDMALDITEPQIVLLEQYYQLLAKWNKAFNLTAIRELDKIVSAHFLDSLAVADKVPSGKMIDVGTGGGFPGAVLAIVRPDLHCSLLDSNGKKCRFLRQLVLELGLKNVNVFHQRVEQHQPLNKKTNEAGGYDWVISRAFASLYDMVMGSQHLLSADGYFYAMKGKFPVDEINEVSAYASLKNNIRLDVPSLDAERHLLIMQPIR